MIAKNLTELIGNTPLMELGRISSKRGVKTILAKIERGNPGGSVKDRVALQMILDAEAEGKLKPGATIIEPTSGNTGVGLAMISAIKGYKMILVMPDTMSVERQKLASAYGADIVLTPGAEGMSGAIKKAEELNREIEGSIIAGQFVNPSNPKAHYNTTGVEIWNDTEGTVGVFVATAGTGGTISGTARRLKEFNPNVKVVAVEPASSRVLSGGPAAAHKIQGIGANFVPDTYDATVIDEVMGITDDEAYEMTRCLAREEGLLVGISSGAAVAAAIKVAKEYKGEGRVVVLLPDTGERYLSTDLF
ncbi:MAG: cysteine synthase A [Bacteroidaceae bacterium]|nr:cysteine synthase A [Bacteroidaceae bacterium]